MKEILMEYDNWDIFQINGLKYIHIKDKDLLIEGENEIKLVSEVYRIPCSEDDNRDIGKLLSLCPAYIDYDFCGEEFYGNDYVFYKIKE